MSERHDIQPPPRLTMRIVRALALFIATRQRFRRWRRAVAANVAAWFFLATHWRWRCELCDERGMPARSRVFCRKCGEMGLDG